MLQFSIIGNIGGDARIEEHDGRKFVSFNVAHTDSYVAADGAQHRSTQWVSCALNGDGGGLLPFLVKGKTVFVQGRGSVRVYSSPKERRMVAGINISVDRIELLSGSSDAIPRQVAMPTGELVAVSKAYYIPVDKAKEAGAKGNQAGTVYTQAGNALLVDVNGFVYQPAPSSDGAAATEVQTETTEPAQ